MQTAPNRTPRRTPQTAKEQRTRLQRAVEEAERGLADGKWVEHERVVAKLQGWAAD